MRALLLLCFLISLLAGEAFVGERLEARLRSASRATKNFCWRVYKKTRYAQNICRRKYRTAYSRNQYWNRSLNRTLKRPQKVINFCRSVYRKQSQGYCLKRYKSVNEIYERANGRRANAWKAKNQKKEKIVENKSPSRGLAQKKKSLEKNIKPKKEKESKSTSIEKKEQVRGYKPPGHVDAKEKKRAKKANKKQEKVSNAKFISPVKGGICRLSGRRYGRYMHPILKRVKPHNGLDLKPNRPGGRDRLIAPADNCRVVSRGTRGGYGKSLKLKCGAYEFFFAHLSSYKVKKGQAVKKGQVVGLMGTTGRSSGVHLHFETFKNGRRIDPLKVYGNNPKKLCDRVDKPKKKYGQKRSRKYQKSKKRNWRR